MRGDARRGVGKFWGALVVGIALCAGLSATAEGPCGDGICEGPETEIICPEDCGPCARPNPVRATVDETGILGWLDRLTDGGFEQGTQAIGADIERLGLVAAKVERVADAARSGDAGVRVRTEGIVGVLALRAKIDKGEDTRYTLWARSPNGETPVAVRVEGVRTFLADRTVPLLEGESVLVNIGTDWTRVRLQFPTTIGLDHVLLILELAPHTTLDIDDASIEAEQWKDPEIEGPTRMVGGIRVPVEPAAPVHFNVLMHIEDPDQLTQDASYFLQKTAVFAELAALLHRYGGFLTIQPEEDWPQGSWIFSDGQTLADLARDYGVRYSTHTHGPACIGTLVQTESGEFIPCGEVLDCEAPRWAAEGPETRRYEETRSLCEEALETGSVVVRPLSNVDCANCICCEDIVTDRDPETPEYVRNLRLLLERASGTPVGDHNGNWRYENLSALADMAGIRTLSAFKKAETQSTFDVLYTNPWRPTHASAVDDPELFCQHDPTTRVIFIPGWGQAITRHPEYLKERLAAMLAQVISCADPSRVNSFYIVTHAGHFEPESEEPYLSVNEATGAVAFGPGFLRDLGYWEETMAELVQPLAEAGYLEWTSLPEIGELFVAWEEGCLSE